MTDSLSTLCRSVTACRKCLRLVRHRELTAREKRAAFRDDEYWGKPIPGFGPAGARALLIGLAPAAHGGNRTGRMFTGDGSASFLISALHRNGFANHAMSLHRGDGLKLNGAYMTAVARCAPPQNRPTPHEIENCRPFLLREIALLRQVRAVLVLGRIAMDGYLNAINSIGGKVRRLPFAHGAEFELPDGLPRLFVSYHPSRQNTQTGRLTRRMFDQVLRRLRRWAV